MDILHPFSFSWNDGDTISDSLELQAKYPFIVSSACAIARLMLDVFTPKCRAISAPERPSSLLLRQAIAARTPLTLRRQHLNELDEA